jgi:hypothetical protein
MEKAIWWIDRTSTWVGIPLCWLVIPLMLVTTWDVNLRYFFNAPTQWAYDVTCMLYGTQFMLGGAYALAQTCGTIADHRGQARVSPLRRAVRGRAPVHRLPGLPGAGRPGQPRGRDRP